MKFGLDDIDRRDAWRLTLVAIVPSSTFVIDVSTHQMFVGGVLPYFLAIFGCLWTGGRRGLFFVSALSLGFLLAGTILKHPMSEMFYLNRATLIVGLIIASYVTDRAISFKYRAASEANARSVLEKNFQISDRGTSETLALTGIEAANVGLWEWYVADGSLVFTRKLEEMLGCEPGERITKFEDWKRRVDPVGGAIQERISTDFAAGRHDGRFIAEYYVDLPDGGRRYFATRAGPLLDDRGEPVGLTGADTDITELRELSEELRKARDAAEAANRAKSAFLANMSHEIRTPMNGVFGMADLLARSALTTDQQRYLNTIRRSGEALLGVINNVLDISRIEAGEFRLDTSTFNIHDLVAEAIELFAESASAKNIFIAHNIAGNVPRWVQGDSVRLRQVLINLIGNAIKFTKDGNVIVRATRTGGTDGDALIRFEVTDTGIGIEREKLVSLFNPFQQADTLITRRFGGTGLGLSIADHIVKLMGGRIDIDSRPGDGSSFVFSISLAIDATKASTYREAGRSLSGKRMLIVDDNAVNREILSEFARGWNVYFVAAAGAVEAQAAIREATHTGLPFDVALIDIVMPHVDGIALAEWIGGQGPGIRTKLIALTSFNWDHDSATSKAAGFSRFATKPVRRAELAQLIEELLAESSGADTDDRDRREPPEGPSAVSVYSARILLAEDNPVNLELAQEYLTRLGCAVTIADDGQKAIDLFSEQDFDLILMDVQMPEVDGIEATRQIRDLEARNGSHRIPIIAATAHAFQEDREKCILAGMDDFLSKPFTGKDIAPILERWLTRSDSASADTAASFATRNESDTAPTAISELLDGDTIAQLRALDETGENRIFGKVVGIFLENTPGQLRQLQKHIAAQDFTGITLVAHSLKTGAANVSALSLSSLLRDIEIAACNEDLQACTKTMDEVTALYEDVSSALRIATSADMPKRKSA